MSGSPPEANPTIPDRLGWVRRTDVRLRSDYPNLVTRIFEVAPRQFVIAFDNTLQDASEIDFEQIRPTSLRVRISNEIPSSYLQEVPPFSDNELAHNFEGLPFTLPQLLNLLVGRFPELPIVSTYDGGSPMRITVELNREISPSQQAKLIGFCDGLGAPVPFELQFSRPHPDADSQSQPSTPALGRPDDLMFIGASKLRPGVPSFVRQDEAFWFENLDRIYAGSIGVQEIPGIEGEDESRCFIDATIGEHVNLRQLLALYDTVYFSPPLLTGHDAFLTKQALSENDLLNLVERGRLKILSTQPEERLNISFLSAAAERSASAIIGRRTTAALLIADIVQTANEYRLRDKTQYQAVGDLSRVLSAQSGVPADQILKFILWPLQVRRAAVLPLLDRGSKGILPIGMGPFFSTFIEKLSKKNFEFECLMISERVHVGHALNATVFSPREEPVGLHALGNAMGDALNFFRSFNTRIAAAWVGNVERKQAGKLLLPPLPLFEFDVAVPLDEILAATDRRVMRNRGRALFSRLADMPDEQRAFEIQELSSDLRRYGRQAGLISLDTLDTGISLVSLAYGFLWPPVAGLRSLGNQLLELARKHPAVDEIIEAIDADTFPAGTKRRELDFLSQISRVATFKTERVS